LIAKTLFQTANTFANDNNYDKWQAAAGVRCAASSTSTFYSLPKVDRTNIHDWIKVLRGDNVKDANTSVQFLKGQDGLETKISSVKARMKHFQSNKASAV